MECESSQFQCQHSGLCIPVRFRCDGRYQCGGDDNSDELGCVNSERPFIYTSTIIY